MNQYKLAGERVDGRLVRLVIPSTSSISASLVHYEVLEGIRVVPFSAFKEMPLLKFYSATEKKRTEELADQIRESQEINPLIVVEDSKGPYILEGGHRFDALRMLHAKAFPALVVLDLDSLAKKSSRKRTAPLGYAANEGARSVRLQDLVSMEMIRRIEPVMNDIAQGKLDVAAGMKKLREILRDESLELEEKGVLVDYLAWVLASSAAQSGGHLGSFKI